MPSSRITNLAALEQRLPSIAAKVAETLGDALRAEGFDPALAVVSMGLQLTFGVGDEAFKVTLKPFNLTFALNPSAEGQGLDDKG